MRESIHRISSRTPRETHGWNSAVMYARGVGNSAGIPRFMKKLPNTLLSTTTVAQIQVLIRSLADSGDIRSQLVAGAGGNRRRFGRLLIGHKTLPFGPKCHVLAGFFREPPPFLAVEHGLPDNPPDHARAEEVLPVKL